MRVEIYYVTYIDCFIRKHRVILNITYNVCFKEGSMFNLSQKFYIVQWKSVALLIFNKRSKVKYFFCFCLQKTVDPPHETFNKSH